MKLSVNHDSAAAGWTFTIRQGLAILATGQGYASKYDAECACNREYVRLHGQTEMFPEIEESQPITRQEKLL